MKNFRLDDESGHQEALFSWAGYNMGRMPELEYSITYQTAASVTERQR